MITLLTLIVLLFVFVLVSQWTAHTPAITDSDGKPLPGSIAALEKVTLGGVEQWLIIRGHDVNKPVLLFLSGGPGASEAARVLRPGAVLGLYDVLAGPGEGAFAFPVPWAADGDASWLAGPETMRVLLDDAGFEILHEEDRLAPAQAFLARMAARGGPPSVGLHLLVGEGFGERMANLAANLAAHRCGPWEFVCRRR
jgi:hypothetical protein